MRRIVHSTLPLSTASSCVLSDLSVAVGDPHTPKSSPHQQAHSPRATLWQHHLHISDARDLVVTHPTHAAQSHARRALLIPVVGGIKLIVMRKP